MMDMREVETLDTDILENIKIAFYRLWKQKVIVIMITLIGFLATFLYIAKVGISTKYYSGAAIYSVVIGSEEDSSTGVTLMNRYSELFGTPRVCDRAAENLQEFGITSEMLSAMVKNGSIYLSGASSDSKYFGYSIRVITVNNTPAHIVEITNAMANAYADAINDVQQQSSVQVLDEATSYGQYKTINVGKYCLLFTGVAFFLACAVIFLKEFFSTKVYSVAQCEQDKDNVLGMIPYSK